MGKGIQTTATNAITSDEYGPSILQAFGVPAENAVKAQITLEVGKPIIVDVEYIADELDMAIMIGDGVKKRFVVMTES